MHRFLEPGVALFILLLGGQVSALTPEMVTIPGTDYEVNGPTYAYEIGKYEITNAQYCAFLNDAELIQQTDPSDPRCTHMWIDTNAIRLGDVFMEDITGYGQTDRLNRMLYHTADIPDSKIKYDEAQAPGSRFYLLAGYENHPVGTVSWFGAAKFCNWATIDAGMDASELCYREGTVRDEWYPITASDWTTNGLLDSERLDLVRNYRGYRLPMDGLNVGSSGPGVATTWNNGPNPYNEWYKAAAFDPAAPDTARSGPGTDEVVPPDHWTFGYGADTNTNGDGNLGNHGFTYPFDETTPVGFYNGVNSLGFGTVTTDTRNRYGLYDMYGNVDEWVSDTALEYPWSATYRCARGGHWSNNGPQYATNSMRRIYGGRYSAENRLGFRVARSPGYGDFDGDGDTDLDDLGFFAGAMTGPVATVTPGFGHEACDYDGDSHVDLWDFAQFQRVYGAAP